MGANPAVDVDIDLHPDPLLNDPQFPMYSRGDLANPKLHIVIAVLLTVHFACAALIATAGVQFETIALSGVDNQYGPQLGPGITFTQFNNQDINARGHVAFRAIVNDGNYGHQIWLFDGARNKPIARMLTDGPLGPNTGSEQFRGEAFNYMSLDDDDSIVFKGTFQTERYNWDGIWRHHAATNEPILLFKNQGLKDSYEPHVANGHVIFEGLANPLGAQPFSGLWSLQAGIVSPLALALTDGALGPQLGPGVTFPQDAFYQFPVNVTPYNLHMNKWGHAVFGATVTGPTVTTQNDRGLWRVDSQGVHPIALEGTPGALGPNLQPGAMFKGIHANVFINDADEVVFRSSILGDDLRRGVFKSGSNGAKPIALSLTDGSLGPQLGPGIEFEYPSVLHMNPRGDVLMYSNLWEFPRWVEGGLWINSGSENVPIALARTDGPHGPQLGPDVRFAHVRGSKAFIDNAGQVIFDASLEGNGINYGNDTGIWAWRDGTIIPLVREGELVEVDTGLGTDLRRVRWFQLRNGTPGESGYFTKSSNADGLVTIGLIFDDGSSGVFITAIPEPSAIVLCVTALVLGSLARLRSRRRAIR